MITADVPRARAEPVHTAWNCEWVSPVAFRSSAVGFCHLRRAVTVACCAWVAALVTTVVGIAMDSRLGLLGLLPSIVLPYLVAGLHVDRFRRPRWLDRGGLDISGDRVRFVAGATERSTDRQSIAGGWLETGPAGTDVVVTTLDGMIVTVRVRDLEQGETLLHEAGLSSDDGATVVPLHGLPRWVCMVLVTLMLLMLALPLDALIVLQPDAWLALIPFLIVVTCFASLFRFVTSSRVIIGRDGVCIRRGRRAEFLAYESLCAVEVGRTALRLTAAGGRSTEISLRPYSCSELAGATSRTRMLARAIQDGISGATSAKLSTIVDLQRGEREWDEWVRDLRASGAVRHDYRHGGSERDLMLQLLEHPCTAPERRLAAAVAVGHVEPETKARARKAVRGSANARLLECIEQAFDERLSGAQFAALLACLKRG
ncbi:MAG: hypothetical protein WKG00_05210 [Polyangiaceae bacterium]